MPRYALKIEYFGEPFVGWQRQKEDVSVQGALEAAIAKLDACCDLVYGAGRTDAGVHAWGQVAHLDLAKDWDPFRLSEALNFHLKPAPIAVVACAAVPDEFHARYGAVSRRYIFRVQSRRAPLTYEKGRVWHVLHPLSLQAMRDGAAHLIGLHDFTTYRSTVCQAASPIKSVDALNVTEINHPNVTEYQFEVIARSFLHNQVRSFVGTLERVGAGSWHPDQVREALDAKDRTKCGPVAPPQGLYLADVVYETDPFS